MTHFQTTAQAIAYALGEPPTRVDWAIGYQWLNGETTYCETAGEKGARWDAEQINLGSASIGLTGREDRSHPVRAFPAFRELRVLADGTQIINPWREAADLDAATAGKE